MKTYILILISLLTTAACFSQPQQSQYIVADSVITLPRVVGSPVVVGPDTLFTVYANLGGITAESRAESTVRMILALGDGRGKDGDSVYTFHLDDITEIMSRGKVIFTVTNSDAAYEHSDRDNVAANLGNKIRAKIDELHQDHNIIQVIKRTSLFVLVLALQYALIRLIGYFYRRLKRKISTLAATRLKSLAIRDYEFLTAERQAGIMVWCMNMCRYALIVLLLIITVPILFSIFPQTEHIARTIFSYILTPVKLILKGIIDYIPNLFIITIIYLAVRYIIKGIKYMANEIEHEKLKITGFYPDWAQPTYNIIRFLLYAFMIAMIYQYLPGSGTDVFKGISVFIGLIVSLGSTTVIGNIMSGLVITYMRPFKIGDRIKLNDTMGNVMEKTPFVTRIRTPKNEIITIPNSFILSSHTTNYSASARNFGLIIHSEVTIGYDAPWRTVHMLLIEAAKATKGVSVDPEPFVLETALSDFYPVYQINAYIQDANQVAQIYSDLHQNIQDKFNEGGVEIMSPHYRAERDGNLTTIPTEYAKK